MATDEQDRTCINCPSYGTGPDSVKYFNKSISAPVCVRFGKVLGKPGAKASAERKLAAATARGCSAFGQPRPPAAERTEFIVAFPDIEAQTRELVPAQQEPVRTCASCANMVRDFTVAEDWGWPAAVCAAKGKLLFPNRYVHEAKGCEYRAFGQPRDSTIGLRLMPEFDDAFGSRAIDPLKMYLDGKAHFVDPTEYPTDREVTLDDKQNGIRAWRKVVDPEGYGDDIYLPIYDIELLPKEIQSEVPRTGDEESPELYVDHMGLTYQVGVMWQELDETPALWGDAGTGKTEFFRYMAWLMCLPFHRISITGSTQLDDLAGKTHFTAGVGTWFEYGRVPKAWQQPGIICIDEPNTGPPDVWQFIRPLTDNSKVLRLDMNKGERIARNVNSALGFAMNPAWDPKNVGTMELGDADANRLMHAHVTLPPEAVEREIIQARVIKDGWTMPPVMIDMVMKIAENIRGLIANDTLSGVSWAIRPQIKVARALRWFPPVVAYRRAIGDSLEPEKREAVLDQVRAHVSDDDVPWH